jgi:hypothetical protein
MEVVGNRDVNLMHIDIIRHICNNHICISTVMRVSNPWTGPEGSRRLRSPQFQDSRHMKTVRL